MPKKCKYEFVASRHVKCEAEMRSLKLLMQSYVVAMIQDLLTKMSLRQISRRIKRSVTYLSLVANEKSQVSPETYLELVDLWTKEMKNGKAGKAKV